MHNHIYMSCCAICVQAEELLPAYTPRLNSDSSVMILVHPLPSAQPIDCMQLC